MLWQKLLVPVLLGLLVYAWTCLLADRLSQRFGPSRGVAGVAGAIVGTLVFAFGVGPLTQFFLRHLVVRLDAPVAVAVEGETR